MITIHNELDYVVAILENDESDGLTYGADRLHEKLNDAYLTLSFRAYYKRNDGSSHPDIGQLITGHKVIYPDKDGELQAFIIRTVEDGEEIDGTLYKEIYAESQALELNGVIIRPQTFSGLNATQFIGQIIGGTQWKIGVVEWLGIQDVTLDEHTSGIQAIIKAAEQFGGEFKFRVKMEGGKIVGRYVDLVERRGIETGIQIEVEHNLKTVKRIEDGSEVYTALIGLARGSGDTEEGFTTFSSVSASDKPAGQDWIGNKAALQKYGILLENGERMHYTGVYTYEGNGIITPARLLQLTREKLAEVSTPKYTYETTFQDLSQITGFEYTKFKIGDTISVINTDLVPPLLVSARIVEAEYGSNEEDSSVVLGDYRDIWKESQVAQLASLRRTILESAGKWDQEGTTEETVNDISRASAARVAASEAQTRKSSYDQQTDRVTASSNLTDQTIRNRITAAKNTYNTRHADYLNIVNAAVTDNYVSDAEQDQINAAWNLLTAAETELSSALSSAETNIETGIGEGAVETAAEAAKDIVIEYAEKRVYRGPNPPTVPAPVENDLWLDTALMVAGTGNPVWKQYLGGAWRNLTRVNLDEMIGQLKSQQLENNAVTADKILDGSVSELKIAADAVTEAKIAVGSVTNAKLGANAVTATKILDGAILEAKLAAGSVTNAKLGTNAVTSAKIIDGAISELKIGLNAVTSSRLADNAVLASKIVDGAISDVKLGANAVTEAKIAVGSVTEAKLGANAVTAGKILDGAILEAKLAAGSVTNTKLGANAVTSAKIIDGAISELKIGLNAVTSSRLADNAVQASKIVDGAINDLKLAEDAVTEAKIASGAVGSDAIKANAVTAAKILAGSIATDHLAANAITSAKISAGAIGTDQLAANAVTAAKILAGSIGTDQLAANSVTAAKILAGSITTSHIVASGIDASVITAGLLNAARVQIGTGTTFAAGYDPSTKATPEYVLSRGENLVTNGTGYLLDDTNFTSFVFDPTEAPAGNGSFKYTSTAATAMNNEIIPVNPERTYRLSITAKGDPTSRHYLGVAPYDRDGKTMSPQDYMYIAGTLTTLAQPLKPGDTVAYLTDVSKWKNSTLNYQRAFIFWDFVSAGGFAYPPESYSKNRSGSDTWLLNAIDYTNNTIALRTAWTGAEKPAGTPLSQNSSGSGYKYIASANYLYTEDWTEYSGTISGTDWTGANDGRKFPPYTAGVKVLFLINRDVTTPVSSWYTAIEFTDISQQETAIDYADESVKPANDRITLWTYPNTTFFDGGKIYTDSITANQIAAGAIGVDELAANSVTAAKILAGSIGTDQLAANAVTAQKILAGSIGTTQLAADAVTADKIAANSVTASELAADSVTAVKIKAGEIGTDHLSANSVTAAKILAGSITTSHIVSTGIDASVITAGTINAARVQIGAGTTFAAGYDPSTKATTAEATAAGTAAGEAAAAPANERIALWQYADTTYFDGGQIYTNSITANQIAASAITADELAANAVTASKILAGSIGTDQLSANAVTASKILAGSIGVDQLAADSVTSAKIVAGAVTATEIAANAVTAAKILAGSIGTDQLAANSITAGKIFAGSIQTTHISAAGIDAAVLAADSVIANSIIFKGVLSGATGQFSGSVEVGALSSTYAKIASGTVTVQKTDTGNNLTEALLSAGGLYLGYTPSGGTKKQTSVVQIDNTLHITPPTGGYVSMASANVTASSLDVYGLLAANRLDITSTAAIGGNTTIGGTLVTSGGLTASSTLRSVGSYTAQSSIIAQSAIYVSGRLSGSSSSSDIEVSGTYTNLTESGICGIGGMQNATAYTGAMVGVYVQFRHRKSYTPATIALSGRSSNLDSSTNLQFADITNYGFWLYLNHTSGKNLFKYWRGTYSA